MRALLVGAVAFAVMEPITALTHRCVMHGVGISLHRSHHRHAHQGTIGRREANDAYPMMFAGVVMLGLAIGFNVSGFAVLVPVGVGVTMYGVCYALVHDVYTHRRVPLFGAGRTVPGLERLAAAHRLHHSGNAAPYGMLVPIARGSRPSHRPVES